MTEMWLGVWPGVGTAITSPACVTGAMRRNGPYGVCCQASVCGANHVGHRFGR